MDGDPAGAQGRGCRTAAYDRRGYGETAYRAESFSHTRDLRAVHDALGGEPAVLVGNSQGGLIAIDFALEFPERVRGLVLVATALSGAQSAEPEPGPLATLSAAIDAADEAEDVQLANELEAQMWLDGPESEQGRVGGELRALFLDMNGRALRAPEVGAEEPAASAVARLPELAMPVHVMLGGRDVAPITARGRWIANEVPRSSATLFEKSAHLIALEEPAAFTADLQAFLERI